MHSPREQRSNTLTHDKCSESGLANESHGLPARRGPSSEDSGEQDLSLDSSGLREPFGSRVRGPGLLGQHRNTADDEQCQTRDMRPMQEHNETTQVSSIVRPFSDMREIPEVSTAHSNNVGCRRNSNPGRQTIFASILFEAASSQ